LATLTSGLTEVEDLFSKFEAQNKPKFCELTLFESGMQAYKELLRFDAEKIISKLESDINRFKKWIENW
jgi:hypothetical protein